VTAPKPERVLPYARQTVTDADVAAVVATLRSDFLTQGPAVERFEAAFAEYVGAKHAVAVANGTAGLHLAALALGTGPGTRVLTTPITFAASANCVRYCGGEVEFVDIDPATALIDVEALRARLSRQPRGTYAGLVVVDFAGRTVDLPAVAALARAHGLWVIEDACHAAGGSFRAADGGLHRAGAGVHTEVGIFSFHPVKHIASGEGGMITTQSDPLAAKLRTLRTHGITRGSSRPDPAAGGWFYEMVALGYNYRLSDLHAALGRSQLERNDAGLARRRALAARYDAGFRGTPVSTFRPSEDPGHAHHLYVIEVEGRRALYDHLKARGIASQVHYIPVHTMPYYREQGGTAGLVLPHAETYYSRCLSLPLFPGLTDQEQDYVIEAVRAFMEAR
jgi:UDP-4-amino-4,6-dideoxy-N-acetyl-beta-L-altrosamine transaminase